jgi:hypothetical protein
MLDTDALRLMEQGQKQRSDDDVTAWADPPAFTDPRAEH